MKTRISRREWMSGVSSVLAAAGLSACGQPTPPPAGPEHPVSPFAGKSPPDRPNIIVFLADTLRADHLGCYGYPYNTSDAIDWIAQQGTLFENNMSGSTWTKPSLSTMLTGVPARVHRAIVSSEWPGIGDLSAFRVQTLRNVFHTLPKQLKSVGYATAYYQSNAHGRPEFGFGNGFDVARYDGNFSPRSQINEALNWLENLDHEPFFLFIHEIDPHGPYSPLYRSFLRLHRVQPEVLLERLDPDEAERVTRYVEMLGAGPEIKRAVRGVSDEANRYIQMKYDAEIYQLDKEIERLVLRLHKLGIMDHTIFTLTSDHGEEFGEHGHYAHGSYKPYRELLHVPLIMVGGGIPHGVRVPHTTTMLDFYPTLLELAGAPAPPYLPGTPMISAAREVLVNDNRFVYIDLDKQSADLSEWDAAIIKGRHKVASNNERSEYLIFDRETDPNERTNLVGTDELPEDLQRTLIAELESQVAHYEQMGRKFGEPEWMEAGEGLKDELEALGYL